MTADNQPGPDGVLPARSRPNASALELAKSLDAHHHAATNGRTAVCRRCGALTDGPDGLHNPHERQMGSLGDWLSAQSRLADAERARSRADT